VRADRLIRLILVLGDGRRRTAAALAEELEVSERTILRDVEALGAAGIPVETARGPEGGIALPKAWARYVAGLTGDEVAALAALDLPSAETALGKVLAALPAMQRAQAEQARQRLLIDPTPWWSDGHAVPGLDVLREAVATDREVRLVYQGKERTIRPLGLVVKADRWYVVADTDDGRRTYRGDRIDRAELTDVRFLRDPSFDLREAWKEAKAGFFSSRPSYPVQLSLTEAGRKALSAARPASEREAIAQEPCVVDFQREDIAIGQLIALGAEATVLAPQRLVDRMRALAEAWLQPRRAS
jgi:predicted DNA-binding transcriptional regulator YafY